jgi:hypothetical protein
MDIESDERAARHALRVLDKDQLREVLALAVALSVARQSLSVTDNSVPVVRCH